MHTKMKASAVALATLLSLPTPALSCGPFFDEPNFQYSSHPDMPLRLYASGKLGIIGSDYARSYLVVAWRYLNNTPLSPAEQKSIVALWDQRMNMESNATDKELKSWETTFKQFDKQLKFEEAYPQRSFNGSGDVWFTYTNCPSDAFANATQTAKKVADTFGASSPELKDWLKAQNTVFCNCGGFGDGKAQIPAAVPSTLDGKLKPYRDYQIAAANFYANNFDKALEAFQKIAADKSSPFHELASYLVLRTMVRKATVAEKNDNALLTQAEKQLLSMLTDKSMSAFQQPVKDLLGFVKFKLGSADRFSELAHELSSNKEGAEAGNNLCDYTFLFDKLLGEETDFSERTDDARSKRWTNADKAVKADDLSLFVLSMQSEGNESFQHILKKWHESKKLYWLVALMNQLDPKSAELVSLSAEAEKVPSSSPAYLHLQYCLAALDLDRDQKEKVRSRVDKILADQSLKLPPGTRNQFMSLRSKVCNNFAEYLKFALQRPVAVEAGWSGCELPNDFEKVEAQADYSVLKQAFPNTVTGFLNTQVPVSLLSTIPNIAGLPAQLKADSLQSVWVRKFLLKDYKALESLTANLKQAIPVLAPQLNDFQNANSPEGKLFTGSLMILKNPGMRPNLSDAYGRETPINKIDDYQNNWWAVSSFTPSGDAQKTANTEFAGSLNAAEKAAAAAEIKTLKSFGEASIGLGKAVLAWTEKSPQDPRLPEALHLAVRATKFCDHTNETSAISKKLFTVLHNKYPKSPWTAKTKYYY